jgi:hypothetical protein
VTAVPKKGIDFAISTPLFAICNNSFSETLATVSTFD